MSEMNEGPQLKMKYDIMRPRPACLICCTVHCCSCLDNCAYSPWYDIAKAFSCGSFSRANVCELPAHTKFHYRETEVLHLWVVEQQQPVIVCNIKINVQFLSSEDIHVPRNADALLITDDVKLHKLYFKIPHMWIMARGWYIWNLD